MTNKLVRVRRRATVIASTAAAATLVLAACSGDEATNGDDSTDASADLTAVSVRLNVDATGTHAPFLLAEENGWYEEEGLDVTFGEGNGSDSTVALVDAGDDDIGIAGFDAVAVLRGDGANVKTVGGWEMRSPLAIVTAEGGDINTPSGLEGATVDRLLSRFGADARILAGGTDLLVQIRSGVRNPRHVIDLVELDTPSGISLSGRRLRVGATTRLWQLEENVHVRERFAALVEGAACVGSVQIRNRATLVGNACNASPAADTAPALLLYDAVASVRSVRGERELPVAELWAGPGKSVLTADEWVEHVTLTDPGPHGSCYVKLGRTRGVDLAVVGIGCLETGTDVRFAAASLAPTARRLTRTEALATGGMEFGDPELDRALAEDVTPITDLRGSSRYRAAMALVCCRRARESAHRRHREAAA